MHRLRKGDVMGGIDSMGLRAACSLQAGHVSSLSAINKSSAGFYIDPNGCGVDFELICCKLPVSQQ